MGLLSVLAANGASHPAGPGVGCLAVGNLLASGLSEGRIALALLWLTEFGQEREWGGDF